MKNRNERLITIRRLIGSEEISSQEELLKMLEKLGFEMTQATLSRDLKFLRIAKIPAGNTGYIYVLPDREDTADEQDFTGNSFNGFVSVDFAQGIVIMKTLPGHAGSIAYALDNLQAYEIAGTIAGDDTILIIPRDGVSKNDMVSLLKSRIPAVNSSLMN